MGFLVLELDRHLLLLLGGVGVSRQLATVQACLSAAGWTAPHYSGEGGLTMEKRDVFNYAARTRNTSVELSLLK